MSGRILDLVHVVDKFPNAIFECFVGYVFFQSPNLQDMRDAYPHLRNF